VAKQLTKNPFEILRVNLEASEDDIRTAYLNLCRRNHPDLGGSEEVMKEINLAYEELYKRPEKIKYWQARSARDKWEERRLYVIRQLDTLCTAGEKIIADLDAKKRIKKEELILVINCIKMTRYQIQVLDESYNTIKNRNTIKKATQILDGLRNSCKTGAGIFTRNCFITEHVEEFLSSEATEIRYAAYHNANIRNPKVLDIVIKYLAKEEDGVCVNNFETRLSKEKIKISSKHIEQLLGNEKSKARYIVYRNLDITNPKDLDMVIKYIAKEEDSVLGDVFGNYVSKREAKMSFEQIEMLLGSYLWNVRFIGYSYANIDDQKTMDMVIRYIIKEYNDGCIDTFKTRVISEKIKITYEQTKMLLGSELCNVRSFGYYMANKDDPKSLDIVIENLAEEEDLDCRTVCETRVSVERIRVSSDQLEILLDSSNCWIRRIGYRSANLTDPKSLDIVIKNLIKEENIDCIYAFKKRVSSEKIKITNEQLELLLDSEKPRVRSIWYKCPVIGLEGLETSLKNKILEEEWCTEEIIKTYRRSINKKVSLEDAKLFSENLFAIIHDRCYCDNHKNHLEVTELIFAGADLEMKRGPYYDDTLLVLCTLKYLHKTFRLLLLAGADINARNKDSSYPIASGSTVTIWAAISGCIEILKDLILFGADLNLANANGDTALHLAVKYNQVESVALLIEAGAELNSQNNLGEDVLSLAIERGNEEIINLISSELSYPKEEVEEVQAKKLTKAYKPTSNFIMKR